MMCRLRILLGTPAALKRKRLCNGQVVKPIGNVDNVDTGYYVYAVAAPYSITGAHPSG
jgi:hypothetical protein